MPVYDLNCTACLHTEKDRYFKVRPGRNADWGTCIYCGGNMAPAPSLANPLTHTFAEDRGVWDHHIRPDGKPQLITSWAQRRKLMRQFNLEDADPRKRRR